MGGFSIAVLRRMSSASGVGSETYDLLIEAKAVWRDRILQRITYSIVAGIGGLGILGGGLSLVLGRQSLGIDLVLIYSAVLLPLGIWAYWSDWRGLVVRLDIDDSALTFHLTAGIQQVVPWRGRGSGITLEDASGSPDRAYPRSPPFLLLAPSAGALPCPLTKEMFDGLLARAKRLGVPAEQSSFQRAWPLSYSVTRFVIRPTRAA
jgi:hypothetical protein